MVITLTMSVCHLILCWCGRFIARQDLPTSRDGPLGFGRLKPFSNRSRNCQQLWELIPKVGDVLEFNSTRLDIGATSCNIVSIHCNEAWSPDPQRRAEPDGEACLEEATMESLLGLYTFGDVCMVTSLSRATIYRYLKRKLFPESGRLPTGQRVWWRADVHRWMRSLFAKRSGSDETGKRKPNGRKKKGE